MRMITAHWVRRMADLLLTYSWVRSSYAALRNLTDHGIRVWTADSFATGMCQWSGRKAGFSRYVSHYDNEAAFIEQIVAMCQKREIRFVLPSHNETEVLAKHRAQLPNGTDAMLPRYEHCQLFNNKARAYELARSLGICVPERVEYDDALQVADRIAERGLSSVVIKMLTGNSAKGVYYANSGQEARRIVTDLVDRYALSPERYPQIEERVGGVGVGCSVLYWNGQPIAEYGHRRLREKVATGGTSTFREAFANESIRAATHRLFSAIGWHGMAMAEFKYCEQTDKYWFIEVNPRMWGSIALAISGGAEFPYLAWLCATEGAETARSYHERQSRPSHWRCRWLLGDAILATSQMARGELRNSLRSLFPGRADALDDFHWDDPTAFLGEVTHYGTRFFSTLSLNPEERGMVG